MLDASRVDGERENDAGPGRYWDMGCDAPNNCIGLHYTILYPVETKSADEYFTIISANDNQTRTTCTQSQSLLYAFHFFQHDQQLPLCLHELVEIRRK
jgi:hypothetical protein